MRHEMEGDEMLGSHHGHHEHHQHEPTLGENVMKMGMKMYFHFGLGDLFLFYGFVIDTNLKLWLASGILFLLALLMEWLHYLQTFRCGCELMSTRAKAECNGARRWHLDDEPGNNEGQAKSANCCTRDQDDHERKPTNRCNLSGFWHRHKSQRSFQTLLQLLRTALSFFLMLAAMTYNLCLIFAILSEAQRESTRIRESQVHLNIELVNGHKIRLQILSHDSADAILTAVCRALGLNHRYHAYFCLCLCAYDAIRDKLIIKRKLSHFESPYVTLQMAIQQQEQLQSMLQQSANYNRAASSPTASSSTYDDSNNNCRCLSCLTRLTYATTATDENSITDNSTSINYGYQHQHYSPQEQIEQAFERCGSNSGQSLTFATSSSSASPASTIISSSTTITPSAFVTHRILLRISYWDPIYDTHILNDPNALNLLFIQTVYDIKHSLMFVNRDTYNQLETLLASDLKKEYIMLARTLKYYNYVHFEPCLSDYPKPRTKVMISIGSKELNMRVLKTPKNATSPPSSSYNTIETTSTTATTNSTTDNNNDNTLAINQVSNTNTLTASTATTNTTTAICVNRGDGTTNQQVSQEQILYCTSSLVPSDYHHLVTKDDLIDEEYNFKIPLIRCWRLTSLETLNSNSTSCSSTAANNLSSTSKSTNANNNKSKRKNMSFFNSQSGICNDNNNNSITEEQQNSFIRRNGSGAASLLAVLTGGSLANETTNGRKQTVSPQFSQYELSFEYLISKDTLRWITISSDQAIFISISLQGVVDELVSKRDGRSSLYRPNPTLPPQPIDSCMSSSDNNYVVISPSCTYMFRDGSKKPLIEGFQHKSDDRLIIGSSSLPSNPYALTLVHEQQQQQQQHRRSSAMMLLASTSSRLSTLMSMSPETSTNSSAGTRSTVVEISNFKKNSNPIINDAFEGVTNDDDL